MPAQIIDGKALAAALRAEVAARVATLPFQPGLAVVLVGDDPASAVYVRNKDRAAQAAGLRVETIRLPASTPESELLGVVRRLNADTRVDGILVQLPLPGHVASRAVLEAIDPAKDVDGFHPLNVGRLQDGLAALAPCTPRGVMKLLAAAGATLAGSRAVVLGRSAIVGRPVAVAAARGGRDGDDRAQPDARPCRRSAGGRTCWSPRWGGRRWCGATGSSRARR